MTDIKLGYLIIYVPDVSRSVEFYERAFGLTRRFLHESGMYAEMETGTTALAFANEQFTPVAKLVAPNRLSDRAASAEVGLVTSDVEAAFRRAVAAGATIALTPMQKPWGQTVSYVRDLDGFLVELCSPMGG